MVKPIRTAGEAESEPIAYSIAEAIAKSGSSKTSIYQAIGRGELRARKNGRRTVILRGDLESWLANLPTYSPRAA